VEGTSRLLVALALPAVRPDRSGWCSARIPDVIDGLEKPEGV
jgi:hypothetical protein